MQTEIYVYDEDMHVIELERITGFDWDSGNERKSQDKHNVGQSGAEQVFFNAPLLLLDDAAHSRNEPRFHALGQTSDGRFLHISFTLRHEATKIRVISARDMHKKERAVYEKET